MHRLRSERADEIATAILREARTGAIEKYNWWSAGSTASTPRPARMPPRALCTADTILRMEDITLLSLTLQHHKEGTPKP